MQERQIGAINELLLGSNVRFRLHLGQRPILSSIKKPPSFSFSYILYNSFSQIASLRGLKWNIGVAEPENF